jgi:Uncharacterised nucleotidyltransferase
MPPVLGPFSLDRVVRAVELVRQRLLRATAALEAAGIPYAVAGGNAIALWVSRVDVSAVRNTSDVDLLVRRDDLEAIRAALAIAGFEYRHVAGIDLFLDGPDGKARDGVRLIFDGEIVRPGESLPNPAVTDSVSGGEYQVLSLRALVQIKLTAYRDKDRTHLRDLLEVGLVDDSWLHHYPAELADRLRTLIDTPGG